MKMLMKRMLSCFLALVMVMAYLPLKPIATYANDGVANGEVEINEHNFPDKTFRDYVSQYIDKTPHNGKLSQNELDGVTEIVIAGMPLSNLKGIEYFKNLKILYCSGCELTTLDVSKNTELTKLDCADNNLTSLDVSNNTELTELVCFRNNLTTLDVSNNAKLTRLACADNNLTSLDLSQNRKLTGINCSSLRYNITVIKGTRKFRYSQFPGRFDKDKATSLVGASLGDDALIINSDNTSQVTYKYKVRDNVYMNVTLHVTYFDPDLVRDIKVKKQPTKLIYTNGENLDLTGLVVTLTDEHSATVDVPFSEFQTYGIEANPKNGKELALTDSGNKVALSVSRVSGFGAVTLTFTAETDALQVKARVFDPNDVKSMTVTTQPTNLKYTDGDKLDLVGLVVRLTDGHGLTRDVQLADLTANNITTDPENGTKLVLANGGKPVTLTRGTLIAATDALQVKQKALTDARKSQPKKHIDVIPQTGESTSLAGVLAALGFSISGLAILRKKKMMKENK